MFFLLKEWNGHISSPVDNIASLSIPFVLLSSIKPGYTVHQNKFIFTIFEEMLSAWNRMFINEVDINKHLRLFIKLFTEKFMDSHV